MNFAQYQTEATKTAATGLDRLYHAAMIASEAGEVAQLIFHAQYHGEGYTLEEVVLELGDILWNMAGLCEALGIDFARVPEANILKLRKRHGETYRAQHYGRQVEDEK